MASECCLAGFYEQNRNTTHAKGRTSYVKLDLYRNGGCAKDEFQMVLFKKNNKKNKMFTLVA